MILVTGATKVIGKEVVRQLVASGQPVKVFCSSESDISKLKSQFNHLTFVLGDILDVTDVFEVMEGVSAVYHCDLVDEFTAADYRHRMKYNVEGTANIVNAMLYHGVSKLIFFSTLTALAAEPEKISDESSKVEKNEWTSEEALSILLAEREAWRGSVEGLEVAVINCANILTHTDDTNHWMADITKSIQSGKVDIYPSTVYYVALKDVIQLALKIQASSTWNKRYLAIGGGLKMLEFYQKISEKHTGSWNVHDMGDASVFFKVCKDFLLSAFTGRNRRYRRVHGKRLMTDLKFDASHTTETFGMKWMTLDEWLSAR